MEVKLDRLQGVDIESSDISNSRHDIHKEEEVMVPLMDSSSS